MLGVREFFEKYKEGLAIELCAGNEGLKKSIRTAEIERPGLALTGFLRGHSSKRVLVFGRVEMEYFRSLPQEIRKE